MNNKNIKLSSSSSLSVFKPFFITGFTDGEGCFSLGLSSTKVQAVFQINLHIKDRAILEDIKTVLGVGYVSKMGNSSLKYQVCSIKDLAVIIEHFDKYPLITHKWSDYELFKQAVELIKRKEHLRVEGFKQLVAIKASINRGLSDKLAESFPDVIPVQRPLVKSQVILDPY
jgi:hypothetical protein